ncbi:MAG: CDP-alcohol phosphatidyltransferase family protein [Candidatus Dormibacteria bacterium]
MFTSRFQAWVRRIAMRQMGRVARLPVTPNQLTIAGLGITTVAALLIGLDHPFYAGLVLLFAGGFDILDGALARASNRSYAYGAFLDSTTDRYAEAVILVALLVFFQRHHQVIAPVAVIIALGGSLMVSYVRARAQSLGFTCDGGLLARPERVLLTVVGLLVAPLHIGGLIAVVVILAVFTNLTAAQRVFLVWRQARVSLDPPAGRSVLPETTAPVEASPTDRESRRGPEPAGG